MIQLPPLNTLKRQFEKGECLRATLFGACQVHRSIDARRNAPGSHQVAEQEQRPPQIALVGTAPAV